MRPSVERLTRTPHFWSRLALVELAVFVLGLGYWLFQIELPYIDTFRAVDYVARRSWSGVWVDIFNGQAEFRPLYFLILKAIHDAAGGPNVVFFRAIQLALTTAYLWMFYALLAPRDLEGWLGFTVGLGCLTGLHTAYYTLSTGVPPFSWSLIVNMMMFGALLLLRRQPSLGLDIAAVVTSMVALLTVETGIAVGLIWMLAGTARWGGASRRTALFVAAALALYAANRFLTNAQPIPGPFYTETGFLFSELTVDQQREVFTGRTWVLFYIYNVISSFLTVVLSEPRAGIYYSLDALVNDAPVPPWRVLQWVTSLLGTLAVGVWVLRWARRHEEQRRILLMMTVALVSNSLLGYLYTRDRLPGVAGAAYAVLLALATTEAWRHRAAITSAGRRTVLTVGVVLLVAGWGWRGIGAIVLARDSAWEIKDEWTDRYERINPGALFGVGRNDERTDALRELLRRRATNRPLSDPREDPRWMRTWFERESF